MSTLGDLFNNSNSSGVYQGQVGPGYLDPSAYSIRGGSDSCKDSTDCASGYTCVGRKCIRQDPTGATSGIGRINIPGTDNGCAIGGNDTEYLGGARGGSSCGGGGATVSTNPDSGTGCTSPGAGQCDTTERCYGGGLGCVPYSALGSSGGGGSSNCGRPPTPGNGGTTISRPKDCDAFCTAWGNAFGYAPDGCPPPCPHCQKCQFGQCRKVFSNCNCKKGGCGTCLEKCKKNGLCVSDSSFSCGNVGGPPPERKSDCKNSPEGCGGNAGGCSNPPVPVPYSCGNPWNLWGCTNETRYNGFFSPCNCCGGFSGGGGRCSCANANGGTDRVRCVDCSEYWAT